MSYLTKGSFWGASVERAGIPSWPSRGITDKKEENE